MFKLVIFTSLVLIATAFDEDVFMSVEELVTKYNYPFKQYVVPTEDGYNLGIHRIRHGLNNADQSDKKVVLIMHQFLTSSADFVSMGNRSLAFLLADKNYDVWLGNARGNTHSRSHATLDPDVDSKFWSFTWEDVGKIDLPTTIDFIISETGASQIYYIGHGQGCTIFYVMASTKPEYNDKIKMMASLAPMAYMGSMPNPLFRVLDTLFLFIEILPSMPLNLRNVLEILKSVLEEALKVTIDEIFKHSTKETWVRLCDDDTLFVEVCAGFISLIYGFDSAQLERSKVPVIVSNAYAGSSYKQLDRYLAYYYTDKFGETFDLSKVTVPTGIFYGTGDWLVSTKDIDKLVNALQDNVVLKYQVPHKAFNHIDFLFAKDAKRFVYDRLFEFLESGGERKRTEL